jgi:hypothetical protein
LARFAGNYSEAQFNEWTASSRLKKLQQANDQAPRAISEVEIEQARNELETATAGRISAETNLSKVYQNGAPKPLAIPNANHLSTTDKDRLAKELKELNVEIDALRAAKKQQVPALDTRQQ